MNLSPFRCLNFLKSWHTTWEMAFQWRGCFSLKEKKVPGKIAPRSSSAWHRKIWYETDTRAKREKAIWAYLSRLMFKLWVWKCHQAAHLQTSNIPAWWEYSEKGHQIVAMQLFCTVFYKHTQKTPNLCDKSLCLIQMCSLTLPLLKVMKILPQAFRGVMCVGGVIKNNDQHTKTKSL